MKLKSFISLFLVAMLVSVSVVFAANNERNVYSVYSDNFNGSHPDAPAEDSDSVTFMLWSNQSMTGATMADTPIEGMFYSKLTCGTPDPDSGIWSYGGGGYMSTNSSEYIDMSAYYGGVLKFCVRSSDSNMTNLRVGVKVAGIEIMVPLSELGFTANGSWQELTFALSSDISEDITAANLGQTNSLFIFNMPDTKYTVGESIHFDNIRWVKQAAGASFSVERKKVSDNTPAGSSKISFSSSSYAQQSWVVADQYLEMDIDGEMTSNNWTIRVFSNNDKPGLYNGDDVLGTAWKVSCSTLPYVYEETVEEVQRQNKNTLEIGENKNDSGELLGLYDKGKVEFLHDDGVKWLYPWFFVKANNDSSEESIILKNAGCHTFENTQEDGHGGYITIHFYDPLSSFYERKPKLYFACNTKNAKAAKYTASFVIKLSYE